MQKLFGVLGLVIIPPTVLSFVVLKEEKMIQVQSCEVLQGRRTNAENVYTVDGEKLEIAPSWIGGPDGNDAWEKLCPNRSARVTLRGARIEQLPFWHRMIFAVE